MCQDSKPSDPSPTAILLQRIPSPVPYQVRLGTKFGRLFNGSFLEELRLYVHPDRSQLRIHYLQNNWYLADLYWRGMTAANVGDNSLASNTAQFPVEM
jgi:hypothetical protein